MLGFRGPAQPSPALGDALNTGYLYLETASAAAPSSAWRPPRLGGVADGRAAPMSVDPIRDAQEAVIGAIAELKAANVAVPVTLHRAAHALSYRPARSLHGRPDIHPAGRALLMIARANLP